VHETDTGKSPYGECTLGTSKKLGCQGIAGSWACFRHVIDEVAVGSQSEIEIKYCMVSVSGKRDCPPSNGHLSSSVTKLCKGGVEQSVLFDKGQITVGCIRFCSLKLHVCVRDLGYVNKVEDCCQDEDEHGNGKVHPLHVSERIFVTKFEENI
jgi:hypothetical protein